MVDFSEKDYYIVGIVNVTPDSFYDKGKYMDSAIARAYELKEQGADIIDLGGECWPADGAEGPPEGTSNM